MYKVKGNTNPAKLAGAIAKELRTEGKVELSCIGAAAVNQAMKGIIVTIGYIAPEGKDLMIRPSFGEGQVEDRKVSMIKIRVEVRNGAEL